MHLVCISPEACELPSTMATAIGTWNGQQVTATTRKANGLGHTYKVGNSYKTVIRHKGKIITATAKTSQESQRKAKAKTEGLAINAYPVKRVKLSLGDFITQWLEAEHRSEIANGTYIRYAGLLRNHIIPNIGSYSLREINPSVITWLLGQMRESGLSPRSAQQARTLLSIALRAAMEKNLIPENPVFKVRNPKYLAKEMNPLSLEEIQRLLGTFEDTYMGARLHIALICGLRQGEALGLRWSDIDLENGILKIGSQIQRVNGSPCFVPLKTQRSRRTIVLTQRTIEALRKQRMITAEMRARAGNQWSDLDLVFPGDLGKPLVVKTDYSNWQKALKLCGISPRRLHEARHSAATLMYSSGVGIETISRALGHSTSAITSRLYVHNAEEPLTQAAKHLEVQLNA